MRFSGLAWIFFLGMAGSSYAEETLRFCPGETLADRLGRENCWVRYHLREAESVCIPRSLWLKRLNDRTAPRCVEVFATSAKTAWLANHSHLSKKPRKTWKLKNWGRAEGSGGALLLAIEREREKISKTLEKTDRLGVARKLVLSESIPDSPDGILRKLGWVHLYSAAGIHLYALLALASALSQAVLLRGTRVSVGDALLWSRILGIAACAWVWMLSGMRPGMLRPLAIVALRSLAIRMGVRWRLFSPLAIALLLDISAGVWRYGLEAWSEWAPGRLHYALAVGGGLAAWDLHRRKYPSRGRVPDFRQALALHWSLSWGSWLCTAVWDLLYEGWVALSTSVVSLVSIPWTAGFFYPLAILAWALERLGLEEVSERLFGLGTLLTEWGLRAILELTTRGGWFWSVEGAVVPVLAAIAAWVVVLFPRKKRAWILVFCVLGVGTRLFLSDFSERKGERFGPTAADRVEQLDVGQGDAAWVHHSKGEDLIDVGSAFSVSEPRWIEIFAKRGVARVRSVFLTHLDEDHLGGIFSLANVLEIGKVFMPQALMETEPGAQARAWFSERSISVFPTAEFDFPSAEVLPKKKTRGFFKSPGNRAMAGVWIPLTGGGGYLNLGDADREQEKALLGRLLAKGVTLDKPVYFKASHHGSRSSGSLELEKRISPREIWISCGLGNWHGHPSSESLLRWEKQGIEVRRTDRAGFISKAGRHRW